MRSPISKAWNQEVVNYLLDAVLEKIEKESLRTRWTQMTMMTHITDGHRNPHPHPPPSLPGLSLSPEHSPSSLPLADVPPLTSLPGVFTLPVLADVPPPTSLPGLSTPLSQHPPSSPLEVMAINVSDDPEDGHNDQEISDLELDLFIASKQDVKCWTNLCHCFLSTIPSTSTLGLKFVEVLVDRFLNCRLQLQILCLSRNFLSLLRPHVISLCMGCQLNSGTLAHGTAIHLAELHQMCVSRLNILET